MSRTLVVDSGNTTRLVKRLFVVDSGNVSRQVKRCFVVDAGNVSRLVYVNSATFTMVAGQTGHINLTIGYSSSLIGSLTPTTDAEGNVIQAFDYQTTGSGTFNVTINIASNPGSSYFSSITFTGSGGTTFTTAAATYGYGSGLASWSWSAGSAYLVNGSTYTVTMTY
jgi:hypothetical protein